MLMTTPPLMPRHGTLAPPSTLTRRPPSSGAPIRQVALPLPRSSPAITSCLGIGLPQARPGREARRAKEDASVLEIAKISGERAGKLAARVEQHLAQARELFGG